MNLYRKIPKKSPNPSSSIDFWLKQMEFWLDSEHRCLLDHNWQELNAILERKGDILLKLSLCLKEVPFTPDQLQERADLLRQSQRNLDLLEKIRQDQKQELHAHHQQKNQIHQLHQAYVIGQQSDRNFFKLS